MLLPLKLFPDPSLINLDSFRGRINWASLLLSLKHCGKPKQRELLTRRLQGLQEVSLGPGVETVTLQGYPGSRCMLVLAVNN